MNVILSNVYVLDLESDVSSQKWSGIIKHKTSFCVNLYFYIKSQCFDKDAVNLIDILH